MAQENSNMLYKHVNVFIPASDRFLLNFQTLMHFFRSLFYRERRNEQETPKVDADICTYFGDVLVENQATYVNGLYFLQKEMRVNEIYKEISLNHIPVVPSVGEAFQVFNTLFENGTFSNRKDGLLVFFHIQGYNNIYSFYGRRDKNKRFHLHKLFVDNNFSLPTGTAVICETGDRAIDEKVA